MACRDILPFTTDLTCRSSIWLQVRALEEERDPLEVQAGDGLLMDCLNPGIGRTSSTKKLGFLFEKIGFWGLPLGL